MSGPRFGEIREVNGTTLVVCGKDGLFRDKYGTVFGFCEGGDSLDNEVRLGVGFFSLSKDHPLTDASRAHDFAFSSPAYQRTNPRSRADRLLRVQLHELAKGSLGLHLEAEVLAQVAAALGGLFWEDASTRWK